MLQEVTIVSNHRRIRNGADGGAQERRRVEPSATKTRPQRAKQEKQALAALGYKSMWVNFY